MADWRSRRLYGFGAARLPLAPVFTPGPWNVPPRTTDALASVREEIAASDLSSLRRGVLLALLLALSVGGAVRWLAPGELSRPDRTQAEIVLIEPAALVPEPLADPEPEVEPGPAPLPVAEAKPEPAPLPPAEAQPLPTEAKPVLAEARPVLAEARPEAPREIAPPPRPAPRAEPMQPAPVRRPPAPHIDALAKATAPTPPPFRVARTEPPPAAAPRVRIDPVAPSFPAAPSPTPETEPVPLRSAARPLSPAAPRVAFPAAPPSLPPPARSPETASAGRPEPRVAPVRLASARPAALARFEAAPPPARYAEAPAAAPAPAVERVARTEPRRDVAPPPPSRAFQGVPLGSLAACVSDREEDALKLEVMAAVGGQRECASRAGRYRFVETKNLNAFLMWIERSPPRGAADRCVELRLALECLGGTSSRRTENG